MNNSNRRGLVVVQLKQSSESRWTPNGPKRKRSKGRKGHQLCVLSWDKTTVNSVNLKMNIAKKEIGQKLIKFETISLIGKKIFHRGHRNGLTKNSYLKKNI